MKNSKEYSDKIEKLYKTLTKKYGKVNPVTHNTILEALIYGAISEHLTDKGTQDTFANILNYFTDFNELRVSRTEEIVEIINYKDDGLAREVARSLIRVLASVFARFNNIDLEGLKKLGKRPAKQAIEQLEGITVFMTDYCMLTALGGHAIPLSVAMIDYLVDQDLVYPSSDQQEIEGFLTRLISANQGYEFYSLLRRESEGYKPKKKRAVVKVEEVHKEAPKETTKEVTTADVIEELPKKEEVVTPKTTTKKVVKKVIEKKTAKKTKTKAVKEKTTRKTSKK